MPVPLSEPAVVPDPRPSLWRRWVVNPIVHQLTQGTSTEQASLAVAFGIAIGIFPIIGSNMLLAFCIGIPLKLNQPILQVFKSLACPLQWALIIGFYRAGEMLYGAPHLPLHIPTMIDKFFAAPVPFFREYGMTALYGVTVWCLLAPFLVAGIYFLIRPVVAKLAGTLARRRGQGSPASAHKSGDS